MDEDAVGRANGFELWGSSKQQGNAVRGASGKRQVSQKHKAKSGVGAAGGREPGVPTWCRAREHKTQIRSAIQGTKIIACGRSSDKGVGLGLRKKRRGRNNER
jgi:hypothetical protein